MAAPALKRLLRAFSKISALALVLSTVPACAGDQRSYPPAIETGVAGSGGSAGQQGSRNDAGGLSSGGTAGAPNAGASGGTSGDAGCAGECRNGGECVSSLGICICSSGFSGRWCERNVDDCIGVTCQNGGVCADRAGTYACRCPTLFTGRHCELARFQVLPADFSVANVSPDGSVVVGSQKTSSAFRAARFDAEGFHDLGAYIGYDGSSAHAANSAATAVVGYSWAFDKPSRAVVWRGSRGDALPTPGALSCAANDVTPDERVIVGTCDSGIVRWVDGAFEALGKPASVELCTEPVVSNDGRVIAGWCRDNGAARAFRWTAEQGLLLLANAPGLDNCQITDLDDTGVRGAGFCAPGGSRTQAIAWSLADGIQALDFGTTLDNTMGISGDGNVLVGAWNRTATVWLDRVAYSVPELLPEAATEALVGWIFEQAHAVSLDGHVVVGSAFDAEGVRRAFVARLE